VQAARCGDRAFANAHAVSEWAAAAELETAGPTGVREMSVR
jgi:hypothetical protein